MATQLDPKELALQEQLARIRQMIAETDRLTTEQSARVRQMIDEAERNRAEQAKLARETRVMPASLIMQAMLATAALLGAGAAVAKVFFPG
ncbi:MAG: hypothetical protein LBV50_10190 [Novosphingobium sp.]|jgi:uncharacterized membrane protein|nr:hypothetical protein [Novosphingobium sp.]